MAAPCNLDLIQLFPKPHYLMKIIVSCPTLSSIGDQVGPCCANFEGGGSLRPWMHALGRPEEYGDPQEISLAGFVGSYLQIDEPAIHSWFEHIPLTLGCTLGDRT